MTNFIAKNFFNSGDHLRYMHDGEDIFIARFRYNGPIRRTHMKKVLIDHYTVEEYVQRNKVLREAPLQIIEKDGHLVFDSENQRFILDGKVL